MTPMSRFLLMGSGEFEARSGEVEPTALTERLALRWSSRQPARRRGRRPGDGGRVCRSTITRRDDLVRSWKPPRWSFFSGGCRAYLFSVPWGTSFLEALIGTTDRGLSFAGCSAGAMVAASLPPRRAPGHPLRWDRRWGMSRTCGLGLPTG